ncbi:MAG TPA: hypothetical protein VLW26_13755 [Steroidobacteraceae bacterium]|nr:hypothetical protein [Steroidobacteraceae bacterium]
MRNTKSPLLRVLGLALMLLRLLGAQAAEETPQPGRWWAGIGLGYGQVLSSNGPARGDPNGVWLEMQLGMRVGRHLLTGFELGGLGWQVSGANYQPENHSTSIYGQGITNQFLVVQYAPQLESGWFLGAAGGWVLYDNRGLEALSGNTRSGNGEAGLLRMGYDWRISRRGHFILDLNYEQGDIRLNAPFHGRFDTSLLSLGFRLSYH